MNGLVEWALALPAHLLVSRFRCLVCGGFFFVEVFGSKQIGHCASCSCLQWCACWNGKMHIRWGSCYMEMLVWVTIYLFRGQHASLRIAKLVEH